MNDQARFDLGGEFADRNYKSCFARSVAVNSQFKQTKSPDFKQLQLARDNSNDEQQKPFAGRPFTPEPLEVVRLRKNTRTSCDDTRRYSCSNISSSRRTAICSGRTSEIPVENIVNQSKIETLQWQLKEIQKSREMYRAVMKQVVTFLEKAHYSLELLGSRINRKNSVPRSKSEHQIVMESTRVHDSSTLSPGIKSCLEDYMSFTDWRQGKEDAPAPDEVPPEKLAQEAFRLLRTAQSLLNTREPDLAQIDAQRLPENDMEFLAQIAKEFPSAPVEPKPHRATSFSLSPKLILPENEVKISTAFNRKLSLQLSEVRRSSITTTNKKTFRVDSARGSVAESDTEFLNDMGVFGGRKGKGEKPDSPGNGSVSSVEDESGFSSMNSFQEVGLPVVNSTISDEVSTKSALLRSMLHNNNDYTTLNIPCETYPSTPNTAPPNGTCVRRDPDPKRIIDEIKLWQKPPSNLPPPQHKRWNSSPSEDIRNQSLKVLWV